MRPHGVPGDERSIRRVESAARGKSVPTATPTTSTSGMSAMYKTSSTVIGIIPRSCCGAPATRSATRALPTARRRLRKLLKVFRAEDPTRPVTAGCDHIASEPASERCPARVSGAARRGGLQLRRPLARPPGEILQHRPRMRFPNDASSGPRATPWAASAAIIPNCSPGSAPEGLLPIRARTATSTSSSCGSLSAPTTTSPGISCGPASTISAKRAGP